MVWNDVTVSIFHTDKGPSYLNVQYLGACLDDPDVAMLVMEFLEVTVHSTAPAAWFAHQICDML